MRRKDTKTKSRTHRRRWPFWLWLSVTVLLMAVFVRGRWYSTIYHWDDGTRYSHVLIGQGVVQWLETTNVPSGRRYSAWTDTRAEKQSRKVQLWPSWTRQTGFLETSVPLWPAIVILAGMSVLTFRFSRRPLPGRCTRCGYHLAGIAQGAPYPECGRALTSPASPPAATACAGPDSDPSPR